MERIMEIKNHNNTEKSIQRNAFKKQQLANQSIFVKLQSKT